MMKAIRRIALEGVSLFLLFSCSGGAVSAGEYRRMDSLINCLLTQKTDSPQEYYELLLRADSLARVSKNTEKMEIIKKHMLSAFLSMENNR